MADLENIVKGAEEEKGLDAAMDKNAEQNPPKEKKPSLEKTVNTLFKPVSYALPVATFAAGAAVAGALSTAVMAAGFVGGYISTNKGKWTWAGVRDTFNSASLMSAVLQGLFIPMNMLPKTILGLAAKVAYGYGIVMPSFNAVYGPLKRYFEKYSPYKLIKGAFTLEPVRDLVKMPREYLKKQFSQDNRSAYRSLWPYVLAQWTVVPEPLMVATSGPISYIYAKALERSGK